MVYPYAVIHVFKHCSTDYDDVTVNFQVHLLFVSDRSLSGVLHKFMYMIVCLWIEKRVDC